MSVLNNNFAAIMKRCTVLYMPSCLIVEMMTRLYSQISMVDPASNLTNIMPDLLVLLRRLNYNLRCTVEAYRESRIKYILGDWVDDKVRSRRIFFNLMSKLGYMSELVSPVQKRFLLQAIEETGRAWSDLDKTMEQRCQESKCQRQCGQCRYFRNEHPGTWQQIMANILASLDKSGGDPDTYFLVLCYKRIKQQLLHEIDAIEPNFPAERILCVSEEDLPVTCPKCVLIRDNLLDSDVIGLSDN
ncbi:MAG: hypothetical protein LIP77_01920, partial [Planctomycetes bacterium]|nr:hypothetical protein [Planctomycetota bacterium]